MSYRKLQRTCLPGQFSTHTLSNNHILNYTFNLLNSNHILYIFFYWTCLYYWRMFFFLSEYRFQLFPLAVAFILGTVFGCVIIIFPILFCRNRYLDTYVYISMNISMNMRKANDSLNVPCQKYFNCIKTLYISLFMIYKKTLQIFNTIWI